MFVTFACVLRCPITIIHDAKLLIQSWPVIYSSFPLSSRYLSNRALPNPRHCSSVKSITSTPTPDMTQPPPLPTLSTILTDLALTILAFIIILSFIIYNDYHNVWPQFLVAYCMWVGFPMVLVDVRDAGISLGTLVAVAIWWLFGLALYFSVSGRTVR